MLNLVRRSLMVKIVGFVVLAQLCVLVVLIAVSRGYVEEFVKEHFENDVEPVEVLINSALAPSLFAEDYGTINERVAEIQLSLPRLRYLQVDDIRDVPVSFAGAPQNDGATEPSPSASYAEALEEGVYHTSFPILLSGETVGHAHVGLEVSLLRVLRDRLGRSLMVAGLVGTSLGVVLIGMLIWFAIRNLRQLDQGAERIAAGDFHTRIALTSNDEIGRLSSSFNDMSAALAQRQAEQLQQETRLVELAETSQRQQARFRALLSAMSLGILFETRDRRVEYINPAFKQMWALDDANDLLGRPVDEVLEHSMHRFGIPPHSSHDVLLAQNMLERSEEFEIHLADGRVVTQVSYPVQDNETRVMGRLWLYEDVTHERKTAEQLIYLAERDSLTGLYNRHRFQQEMERMLSIAQRYQHSFALLYFDLDEFKYVNDTYGHREGDTVLTRIASELSQAVRQNDIFARLGGDEFAILSLIDDDQDDVLRLADRIVSSVSQIPFRFRGQNIRMTTSVGISIYPSMARDPDTLIAQADTAMYQAKSQGKNTWSLYDRTRDTSTSMMKQMTWSQRIEHGLDAGGFELHFQGVYAVQDRQLSHFEALVRLRDSEDASKLFLPGQFIPIAEKTGKILAIDQWVLRQVIQRLSDRPELPPIAVNISGRSFDDPSLPQRIRQWLTERQVAPSRLMIELTETAAVSDFHDAQRFIEALHQTGCRVCLDDFGSGFSSFAYLKHVTADVLKIDGQFIRDLPNNPENQIFLRAILDVAKGLNKMTVAEFVDSEAVFNMLKDFGVDYAQGYHLDKPQRDHPAMQPIRAVS